MAISVADSFRAGLSRTTELLFRPVIRKKWAAFGFAAWLAEMNELHVISALPATWFVRRVLPTLTLMGSLEYVGEHLRTIMSWLVGIACVAFVLYVLLRWINCRGKFMMLAATAEGAIDIKESWRRHRSMGNNLLWFRIKWDLALFNLYLAVLVIAGAMLWPDFRPMMSGEDYRLSAWTWGALAVLGVGLAAVTAFVVVAQVFFHQLLVPVMFVKKMSAGDAFRHARREALGARRSECIRYLGAMLLAGMVRGAAGEMALILVGVVTCFIGCVMMELPVLALVPFYLATTLLSEFEVFLRAMSLDFVSKLDVPHEDAKITKTQEVT